MRNAVGELALRQGHAERTIRFGPRERRLLRRRIDEHLPNLARALTAGRVLVRRCGRCGLRDRHACTAVLDQTAASDAKEPVGHRPASRYVRVARVTVTGPRIPGHLVDPGIGSVSVEMPAILNAKGAIARGTIDVCAGQQVTKFSAHRISREQRQDWDQEPTHYLCLRTVTDRLATARPNGRGRRDSASTRHGRPHERPSAPATPDRSRWAGVMSSQNASPSCEAPSLHPLACPRHWRVWRPSTRSNRNPSLAISIVPSSIMRADRIPPHARRRR